MKILKTSPGIKSVCSLPQTVAGDLDLLAALCLGKLDRLGQKLPSNSTGSCPVLHHQLENLCHAGGMVKLIFYPQCDASQEVPILRKNKAVDISPAQIAPISPLKIRKRKLPLLQTADEPVDLLAVGAGGSSDNRLLLLSA